MRQVASLIRRGVEIVDGEVYELPSWVFLVVLANVVVFFPVFIYLNYTLGQIFPVLAIVENENPPAYEPVALNEDAEQQNPAGAKVDGTPITTSLRGTGRLLSATGGFFAKFRGITVWAAFQIAATVLTSIFAGFFLGFLAPFATLLANLATVQLETAWVHIVMSHPTGTSNWKRFPTFKRAFDATWKPIVLFWLASEAAAFIPVIMIKLLHFKTEYVDIGDKGSEGLKIDGGDSWKGAIVMLTGFVLVMGVVLPAKIILVRIQASLLPEADDPIVPFDRSFQGQVEPAVVTGKGYATIRVAWSTITTSAWRRIIMLQFKVLLVNIAAVFLMAAIAAPQLIWIMSLAEKKEGHN